MKTYFFFLIFLFPLTIFSQEKKIITAVRTLEKPTVDGNLSDSVWQNAQAASGFTQYSPHDGQKSEYDAQIKILYDDNFIYVFAKMFDSDPQNIYSQLTKRDDTGVADYIGISFDPFNDAKLNFSFFVTAAGVQTDKKVLDGNVNDTNWDAVWKSRVAITSEGWDAEFQIPYSALRFSNNDVQKWGINFFRYIGNSRESSAWNPIDPSASNRNLQNGLLHGIKNIKSPVRLSLRPFIATYLNKQSSGNTQFLFKGGMDLKYGINESFTLDMMLIPDFGQVQSDDQRLNLSPFELYYEEKRAFFTEGTELFDRAGIFYSRRIGGTPNKYYEVYNQLAENEIVEHNPGELRLLNATKITGKTQEGLSLGLLNGVAMKSIAQIKDTISGDSREFVTQDYTNYNVLAVEQTLKNNSYISLINTNYLRGSNYLSNVLGIDIKIADKKNKYALMGSGAVSYNNKNNNQTTGGFYNIRLEKISGNFTFLLLHKTITDTYTNNDLGYLSRNNYNQQELEMSYRVYKPKGKFLNYGTSFSIENTTLYNPAVFTRAELNYSFSFTLKNHISMGANVGGVPINAYDYYEPRVENRYVITPSHIWTGAWISSDYSKTFAIDLNIGWWEASEYNQGGYWYGFSPRIRLGNKFLLIYSINSDCDKNVRGFAGIKNDTIYFGARTVVNLTNTIDLNYIFNNKSFLSLRTRHFRSTVDYNDYFILTENGRYTSAEPEYSTENINFNAFNVDLVYTLEFMPGSFISFAWKNEIYSSGTDIQNDYFTNFASTMRETHGNSISLKLVYYLDYSTLKNNR